MHVTKLVGIMFLSIIMTSFSWLPTNSYKSSVSKLIASGASESEILETWGNLVLERKIVSYTDAEALVTKTMQVAYLQGNRTLGASITKTAYYNALTVVLGQEIGKVQVAMQRSSTSLMTHNFKLQPDGRDLQKLGNVGRIDLKSQRSQRSNLITKAQMILSTVPGMNNYKNPKAPITGKNTRQANLPAMFSSNEIMLSGGSKITSKEALQTYFQRLQTAFNQANNNMKQSATQLQNEMLIQQQMAQNEITLSKKLLLKAATIIND